ncbi:hypothetical protein VP01_426g7 [Puccinia sorghi]|uniref:Uncharacterized protein n=1 Tax=Puccinia sorghi TaxID=27349 RepID=A0A0L6UQB5_9BASI|nr:hypothetical protein VP01_426g7 [Puccinia sorghi]
MAHHIPSSPRNKCGRRIRKLVLRHTYTSCQEGESEVVRSWVTCWHEQESLMTKALILLFRLMNLGQRINSSTMQWSVESFLCAEDPYGWFLNCLEIVLPARAIMEQPAKNPGKNATKPPEKKPCFVVDPLKLQPGLRNMANPNVQCIQDGVSVATNELLSIKAGRLNQQLFLKSISLATLPDLRFQGIKYDTQKKTYFPQQRSHGKSSIDYSRDVQSTPAGFSIDRFTVLSTTEGRNEKLGFLKASKVLYESVWLGLRSLDMKNNIRQIRELETVIGILNLQVHRLESDVSAVEAAADHGEHLSFLKKNGGKALKRCFECNVKDRYNIIVLGSQSGVNVDKFLENLPGLRCKSQRECSELIDKGESTASKDNAAQLTVASPSANTDPKSFVTSNPALSGSSGLNFALLSASKCFVRVAFDKPLLEVL